MGFKSLAGSEVSLCAPIKKQVDNKGRTRFMEAKDLANYITIGTIGIGLAALAVIYLRGRVSASAKAAWSNAPTLSGFLTFCIWFVILAGIGGMWVGGRMALYGAPNAVAQGKGK